MTQNDVEAHVHGLIQSTLLGEAAENVPLAVFVADEDMNYVAVNPAACELVGYTRKELLTLKVSDVAPDPPLRENWEATLARGRLSGRGPLRRKDGTELAVDFWAYTTRVAQMIVYVAFIRPSEPDI
jgi:PAS domain S-box-containing protein